MKQQSSGNVFLQGVSAEELYSAIRQIVREEVAAQQPEEKLLSPAVARKLFSPPISLVTLDKWTKEGRLQAHYFGKKKYYKQSEIIANLETLVKYKTR